MKQYTEHIRGKLRKLPKKLIGSLAAAAVVVTTLVTANPMAVQAAQDENVNPRINIQHYLYFSAVSVGEMVEPTGDTQTGNPPVEYHGVEYYERTRNDWEGEPWVSPYKISTDNGTVLPIYNNERRSSATPTNGKDFEPKYGVVLNGDGKFSSHIRLKQLFLDEKVNYLDKPQIQYMNRLYDSNGSENKNYTLSEIWVSKPEYNDELFNGEQKYYSNTKSEEIEAKFRRESVPLKDGKEKVVGSLEETVNGEVVSKDVLEHDPSRVTFTNNPDYIDADTKQGLNRDDKNRPIPTHYGTGADERLVIPVSKNTTIRFVFEPTDGTTDVEADFFDYDITDGQITGSDAQGLPAGEAQPTTNQAKDPSKVWYANTKQQGINNTANYKSDPAEGKAKLAFGNSNAGTGLQDQTVNIDGVSNNINKFNATNRGVVKRGNGSVFGLVSDTLTESGDLIWNKDVDAPDLFSKYDKDSEGKNRVIGKKSYVDGEYDLSFKRVGGTYALQNVNRKKTSLLSDYTGPTTGDLTKFSANGDVYANNFWPLDGSDSHAQDGHDLLFGSKSDEKKRKYGTGQWDTFPTSDDEDDHNSYFGMKSSVDFVLDPGYSGPLRYYFYGDDDLFVYLTELDGPGPEAKAISTEKIADVGGVHRSVGVYVNLWTYIGKPTEYTDANGNPQKPRYFRLTYFYTERGASGSSCYMRFTVPFESLTTRDMEYTGMIQVEKEVKGNLDSNEEYSFRIDLKYPNLMDGTPVSNVKEQFDDCKPLVNRYKYEIWERAADGGKDKLVKASLGDPDDKTDDDYVYHGKVMKLKHNQYLKIYGLPGQMVEATDEGDITDTEAGDPPSATLYKITELETEGNITTTFASGKVNEDGTSTLGTDFEPGKVVMGTTQEENYVKYINAQQQGALTLNKAVEDTPTTTEPFTFKVNLEAPEGFTGSIGSLGVLRNGLEETDLQPEEDGSYTVTLNWNADTKVYDTVTLYNVPRKSAYTVTEQKNGNYLPSKIEVTGGVNNQTFLSTSTAQGIVDTDGQISDTNLPFVTVSYTNTYQPNTSAQIKVNKTITGRPALSGGETFAFRLEGADDKSKAYLGNEALMVEVPVEEGKKNAEVLFPEMHFTKDDIDTVPYLFNITEVSGGQHLNDLDYDGTTYQAAVLVGKDEKDNLAATITWTKDGKPYTPAENADGAISFENVYSLSASEAISFTKTVEGEAAGGDIYKFIISSDDEDAPMPAEKEITIVNDGSTTYTGTFGPIAFTDKDAGKTYTYTIQEKAEITGMVTDPTIFKATYKIEKQTDNRGYDQLVPQLTVTRDDGTSTEDTGIAFKNIYRKASVAIPVTKTIQGRQMRPDETFAFQLLEKDDNGEKPLQTLTIQGEEGQNSVKKYFNPIEFVEPVENKEYIVREIQGSDTQMTYDTKDHIVKVTVAETDNQELAPIMEYDGSTTLDTVSITNVWNTTAYWAPHVNKHTLGGSPEGYTFRMEMKDTEGATLPEKTTAQSDAQGNVTFDPIAFTKEGKYEVTVSEEKGTDDSIVYDDHNAVWNVSVDRDDKTGDFIVTPSVNSAATLFTNDAGLRITKNVSAGTGATLTDADLVKKFVFTLSFQDAQGNDLTGAWKTVIRDSQGNIIENDLSVTNDDTLELSGGQTAYIYGLPAGTTYSIDEKAEAGWFNVEKHHSEGGISEGAPQKAVFTNVKLGTDTGEILGYKSLINTGMNPNLGLDSFRFEIEGVSAEVEDTPQIPSSREERQEETETPDTEETPEAEEQQPEEAPAEAEPEGEADMTDTQQVVMSRKTMGRKMALKPEEMPMPAETIVSSNEIGEIRFGSIEFNRAGIYVYKITEINNDINGVVYSQDEWMATVTVENVMTSGQVTGVKVTDIAYSNGTDQANAFTFTNEFKGTPGLELHKTQSIQGGEETTETVPVKAGDLVTYYLRVTAPETATAAARNVVITDVIPEVNKGGDPAAQLQLINSGGASYDEKTKTLTWNIGDVAPRTTVTVRWTVQVPKVETATSWTNIAAANYSNNPDDPLESEEVTIETEPALPNVTIRKAQSVNKPGAVSTSDFSENEQPVLTEAVSKVIYRLTVTNDGDAAAKNVIITDVIPKAADGTQLEFLQVYDDGAFDRKTQTLTWTLPELKAGESANVRFAVTVPTVKTATQWTNQATVKHQDPKDPTKETPEVPSNEVTVETDVPALTIHKEQALNSSEEKDFTTELLSARPGDIITYRMTVTNPSKVDVPNVVVKDTVPIGTPEAPLAVVSGSVSEGGNHYADGTIVWNLGTMQAGESRFVSFQVKVPVVTGSTKWTNVATVTNPQDPDDPTPSNPVDSEAKAPELKLEKFQNFEDMAPTKDKLTGQAKEEIVTYTLKASNTGEYKAENVIITDEIPAGTTLVEGSISDGGTRSGNVITWKLGNIEPGEAHAKSVTFQVKLNKISEATTWRNVAAAVYDNNPENPEDPKDPKTPVPSNKVEIEADVPALSIVKSQRRNDEEPATPILVEAGDTITYALTVTSTGKSAAQDVVIKDPVPEGLELIEGSISDGGKAENGVITWNVGTMDPGAEKTVTFKVRVPQVKEATTWINAASTTYSNREDPDDPIPSNEVESRTDVPHLVIEKEQQVADGERTKDLMEVNGEDIVTYYVTVTNDGQAKAEDVRVTDAIPEGLTLVEGSISDKGTVKNGVITWKLGDLEKGETRTVSFKVLVPVQQGTWRNIAYTSYPNNPDNEEDEDPREEPSNPVDIVEIPEEGPKLLIDKTQALNSGTFTSNLLKGKAGDVVTYALTVRNVGKAAAEGVTVTDVVPVGLRYVEGSASHEAVYENGRLTWSLETLEPGASVTLQFQARLPMDNAAGTWKNVAKLTYQNDPEGPDHETPSNEVEVRKDPGRVPVSSTNGRPHPGAGAPTATGTGVLAWTLLGLGAAAGTAGLAVAGSRRRRRQRRS